MNDRTPSGEFAEPAYGQAGLERDAGYTPMADPSKKDEGEELTLDDAAEIRASEATGLVRREYTGDDGPVDRSETVTLERAASDLTALRRAEHERAENEASEALREHIDALRGDEGTDTEPKAATNEPAPPVNDGDIEPELERALSNPRIAEAIRAQVAETETARQQYRDGVDAAMQIAQQAFMGQFPEFANVTSPEQAAQVAQAIAQQNPGRWAQIQSAFSNSTRLFEAQRVESQRAAERQATEFADYAKEQDRLVDAALKGVPATLQQQINGEIFAMAKEYGLEPAEFMRMFNQDRTMRHSAIQRMAIAAARYRMIEEAKRQTLNRQLPHVARPGGRTASGGSGEEKVRALTAAFQANPSLKTGAALAAARRANRG